MHFSRLRFDSRCMKLLTKDARSCLLIVCGATLNQIGKDTNAGGKPCTLYKNISKKWTDNLRAGSAWFGKINNYIVQAETSNNNGYYQ